MRKILLGLGLLLTTSISFAQNDWCGSDRIVEKQIEANPELRTQIHESLLRNRSVDRADRVAPYEIPVVFHIIHDNGIGDISMSQIEDGLRILNEDYNRTNADASSTRNDVTAPFADEAASCEITFKLAKRDPQGNCTNGVLRVNAGHLTYAADDACKQTGNGGSSAWPRDEYMNIWVVNSIDTDGEGITLGYAYLPYSPNGNNYGILIRHDAIGSIETANYDGRTLTHEMGHSLGLLHTFQGGWGGDGCHTTDCASNGDYCCDTPPSPEATWSCNQNLNGCSDVPANDTYGFDAKDQIENYMSYNSCQNMFSKDQRDLIQDNLDGNIDFLEDLVHPSNITASGINEIDQLCKADFILSDYQICSNNTITLIDDSYHGPNGWTWTISGTENVDWEFVAGSDENSQNPEVNMINSGVYNISLSATDGSNNDSETKNSVLTVLEDVGQTLPYSEGFEDYANIGASPFLLENSDGDATWAISTTAATGSKSAKISNFGISGDGKMDELMSETIDLSSVSVDTNVTFSFKYAYNKRSASNDEWLRFYISSDCGESWSLRKNIHGNSLSSETSSTPYTPTSDEWIDVVITNITSASFVSNFRYRFSFENDNGNNIYVDDINLIVGDPVLNIEKLTSAIGNVEIYPNPAETVVNMNIDLLAHEDIEIQLLDITGRKVQSVFNGDLQAGSHQFNIDRGELKSGTYFLNVVSSKGTLQKRVVFK